jgi:CubicO group peptidase (beta-lactamase class C family)
MLRTLAIGVLLIGTALQGTAASEPPPDQPGELIKQRVADADAPGCIAVGLIREETTFYFACSEEVGPVRIDKDSLFEIGSISKGLTGLLLADMVRKGEVKLDDPASKYSRPGAKLPTRGGRQITLRNLVTHSAGLPRMPPGFNPRDRKNPYSDFDVDALYVSLRRTELERDIGSWSAYSNLGFMWLSDILSRVGGKPFPDLLKERILEPLGMTSTTVRLAPEAERHRAIGHNVAYRPVSQWDIVPELAGVGGVRSSISDMTRLAEALSGRRETPLAETIALALNPLFPSGDMPFASHIGYGWFVREHFDGLIHWHGGNTAGFSTMLAVDRKAHTGTVILSDVATNDIWDLSFHLVVSTWPLRYKGPIVPLAPEAARQYEGRYEVSPTFALTIFNHLGRTYSQGTNQEPVQLKFLGKDRFDSVNVPAQLQFSRTPDGNVDSLTLVQGGMDRRARRADVPHRDPSESQH